MKATKTLLALAMVLSFTASYAQSLYAPSVNNGSTIDVIMLNNSGHTLIFQNSSSGDGFSSCAVVSQGSSVAPGAYMIIRGTYTNQGGDGLSCRVSFTDANNESNNLYLEIFDPTYIYQGGQEFRFYDGATPITSEYTPAKYPDSNPTMLMDQNVTIILNSF